jgi:hypothetical protein
VAIAGIVLSQERSRTGADRLSCLAAAPTFAAMALLTVTHDGGMPGTPRSAMQDASPPTGMTTMYLLMSAFNMSP